MQCSAVNFVSTSRSTFSRRTKLTIPPAKLLTSTGTLVSTTVLVVTKMNETDEMLIKDVGRTLSQL
jgi:hypothetical protein